MDNNNKMRDVLIRAMLPEEVQREVNKYLAACAMVAISADERTLRQEITAIVDNGDLPAFDAITQYMVVGFIADHIIEECQDRPSIKDLDNMSEQERWLRGE